MAVSLTYMTVIPFKCLSKPGIFADNSAAGRAVRVNRLTQGSNTAKFQLLVVKAADGDRDPKTPTTSLVCSKCEGNGAIACTQCKGSGINAVDHFNGQFKAGRLCWLCRGKREILCGSCNGAGFTGGIMSSFDD